MIIRERTNSIEIIATEREPTNSPRAGDTRFEIAVNSEGFCARSSAWVGCDQFNDFMQRLCNLEAKREGCAKLESMSPGELSLEFKAIDRWGHIAVCGRIMRYAHGPGSFDHALEFGFAFDSADLLQIVADFKRITMEAA
jgi:hypothetical protein